MVQYRTVPRTAETGGYRAKQVLNISYVEDGLEKESIAVVVPVLVSRLAAGLVDGLAAGLVVGLVVVGLDVLISILVSGVTWRGHWCQVG